MLLKKHHHHHYPHNLIQANGSAKMDYFLLKQKTINNNNETNKKSGCYCCCCCSTSNNCNVDHQYHNNFNQENNRRRSTNMTNLNSSFIDSSPIKPQTISKPYTNLTTATSSVSSLAASLLNKQQHHSNRHTYLNSSQTNANQSFDNNYFYSSQREHQPCIIQPRSHSKSRTTNSSIQKLVKLELVKSRNKLVPSSSNVDFNNRKATNNTQNYLIKYPNTTSSVIPCSKSSASIKSLCFSNSNNNSNKLVNLKQDVNVYDEIITSDQDEYDDHNHFSKNRNNTTNDYELLSNLNSSLNSNNTSLNSSLTHRQTNKSSMICMNNNRINSLTSCNNLQNKITSTINCFKSFGQNTPKQMPVLQNKSYANSAIRYHHVTSTVSVPPPIPPSHPPPKLKQTQQMNLTGSSSQINHSTSYSKNVTQYDSSPTSISSDNCDSISSCSSSISSKSIFFAKNSPSEPKKSKSPVVSSGYNSSQDQENSFFTNSFNKSNKTNNYNSTILSYVGLSGRDYLAPKKAMLHRANDDSGLSTMHENLSKDYFEHDDSTSSNISSFLSSDASNIESSSISMSCMSNSSSGFYNGQRSDVSFDETNSQNVEYMHLSPFPRVKTCLIAQIKQLDSNGNSVEKKKSLKGIKVNMNKNEPLYENLTTIESNKKNYSVHDILQSLNSLEFHNTNTNNIKSKKTVRKHFSKETEEDLLCDEEVQYYLNRVENCSSLNEQHQYQFGDASIASIQSSTEQDIRSFNNKNKQSKSQEETNLPKSFNTKILKNNILKINRPMAFWEQLV